MRLGLGLLDGKKTLIAERSGEAVTLEGSGLPLDPLAILTDEALRQKATGAIAGAKAASSSLTYALPLAEIGKIICVGLNYADHAAESPYARPDFPVYFLRVHTSLIAANEPIVRPKVSEQLDFEGELVAVIGKKGRNIPMDNALQYVAAYSLFNDASVRDWQFKGPQWTLGKNFDATGPFGPYIVSADELPAGAKGLRLTTKLNGQVVQDASTNDLLFPVAEIIARASEAMTLNPGDIIVTGTPAGVGFARKPPLFMKAGDVCEIEVERVGILKNPIVNEAGA
jgi:acylpyruvate hydrolase